MGVIWRVTKQLFGRKKVCVDDCIIIDGEIINGVKNRDEIKTETEISKTRFPEIERSGTESVMEKPELIEAEAPIRDEREAEAEIEPSLEPDSSSVVPDGYLVFLGACGRAERTIKEYTWDLKWWNKQCSLDNIKRQDIEKSTNNMHAATARRKIAVLRSFAKWQLRDGNVRLHNEVSQMIPPKIPGRVPKDRGPDAFKKISQIAIERTGARDRRGIWLGLMLCCGLRISEVQTVELSNGGAIKVTGKGNKERLVPAPVWLCEAISKHYSYGDEWRQSRHLIWLELKRMDMKKPHSLRHTYASELVRCGFALEEVQMLLGHSKLDTTLIYAKVQLPDDVTTRLGVEN